MNQLPLNQMEMTWLAGACHPSCLAVHSLSPELCQGLQSTTEGHRKATVEKAVFDLGLSDPLGDMECFPSH